MNVSSPTSPEDSFDYDSIPPGYYDEIFDRRRGIQSKWHHVKFAGVRRAMEHVGGTSVLDLGCGPGTFAAVLPDYEYTGVDLAAPQIEYARRKYGDARHRFLHSSSTTLPLDNDQFDLVTSVEVIEHISAEAGAQMLSEAFRVLRPGGAYRDHDAELQVVVARAGAPRVPIVADELCGTAHLSLHRAEAEKGSATGRIRASEGSIVRPYCAVSCTAGLAAFQRGLCAGVSFVADLWSYPPGDRAQTAAHRSVAGRRAWRRRESGKGQGFAGSLI